MRSQYRAIAVAFALSAATPLFAQTSPQPSSPNPLARSEVFLAPGGQPQIFGQGTFANTGIGRPGSGAQVTPVPEPSQWALMLAGLALVGFIARRTSRKSRDPS